MPRCQFLIVSLGEFGLGAHVRHVFVAVINAALISGRVILFLNNAGANEVTRGPWQWSSCHRKDFQCVFMPTSPCVLTESELQNGTIIESGMLTKNDTEWDEFHDKRVLILGDFGTTWGYHPPVESAHILATRAHDLVERIEKASQRRLPVLRKAAEYIRTDPRAFVPVHMKKFADFPLGQIASIYALRPNLHTQEFLQEEIKRIFPPSYDPQYSFGLPIRSSDKCWGESSCLSFDAYMQLAMQQFSKGIWNTTSPGLDSPRPLHLILTSKNSSIIQLRTDYENQDGFPFSFVVNEQDTSQGTGFAGHLTPYHLADDVILSTLVVLKMHLQAKHIIGNCCSSFHSLIFDFVRRGCGIVHDATVECLRDNEEKRFRICCMIAGEKCEPTEPADDVQERTDDEHEKAKQLEVRDT